MGKYNEQVNRDLFYERDALSVKVNDLSQKVRQKDNEIEELKKENTKLQQLVNFFENAYDKIKGFFRDKIFSKDKTESLIFEKTADEFYEKDIFSSKDYDDINNERKARKDKDDYEMTL